MVSKKSEKNHINIFNIVVVTGLIVVIAICAVAYVTLSEKISDLKTSSYVSNEQAAYRLDKLAFCFENSLSVCSDDSIRKWNDEQPDSAFALKTDQQLVEQAIERDRLEKN